MTNSLTASEAQGPSTPGALKCGDVGTYREQRKQKTNKQNRDHVPATQSMLAAAEEGGHFDGLSKARKACMKRFIKMDALTVAIPYGVHKKGRTYAGKGGQARVDEDVKDLKEAAKKDFAAVEPNLSPECQKKYEAAKEKMLAQLPDKHFKECRAKAIKQC
jgi:hypothetical protein